MKRTRIFLAIVLGCTFAIAGCGSDNGDSLDQALGNGGTAEGFCATICGACGGGVSAECASQCEASLADAGTGVDFDSCPTQENALGACLSANNCDSNQCTNEFTAYIICVAGVSF